MANEIRYTFKDFCELNENEILQVWNWRNNIDIRKWMYDKSEIPLENHLKFIESLKGNNQKKYFLVIRNSIPLGVFSIVDINDSVGEWGYYIGNEFHNENYGVEFYYNILKYIFENLDFNKLYGFALVENRSANSLNTLFKFSSKLQNKETKEGLKEFLYRELYCNTWDEEVKEDKKIIRLLELTNNK